MFGSDTNALDVFWPPDGHVRIDMAAKTEVAERLLDVVAERFVAVRGTASATGDEAAPEGAARDGAGQRGGRA